MNTYKNTFMRIHKRLGGRFWLQIRFRCLRVFPFEDRKHDRRNDC